MAAAKPGAAGGTNLLFSASATEFSFTVPFIPVSQAPAPPSGSALLAAGREGGRGAPSGRCAGSGRARCGLALCSSRFPAAPLHPSVVGCGVGGSPEEPSRRSRGLPRGAAGLVAVRARYVWAQPRLRSAGGALAAGRRCRLPGLGAAAGRGCCAAGVCLPGAGVFGPELCVRTGWGGGVRDHHVFSSWRVCFSSRRLSVLPFRAVLHAHSF